MTSDITSEKEATHLVYLNLDLQQAQLCSELRELEIYKQHTQSHLASVESQIARLTHKIELISSQMKEAGAKL